MKIVRDIHEDMNEGRKLGYTLLASASGHEMGMKK